LIQPRFNITTNIPLSVALGMGLGVAQIAVQFARRRPIETMEWLSLFLVVASGTAALITDNPRFVLFKPSVLYTIVGYYRLSVSDVGISSDACAALWMKWDAPGLQHRATGPHQRTA